MKSALSDNAQALVARSLPLLEREREALQRAIGRYMARGSGRDRVSGRSEAAARAILAMLIGQARGLVLAGHEPRLGQPARFGGVPGLASDDYSRFGDGLGAALRDVLGPRASPALLWAWGDAYWALVRAARRKGLALAA